MLDGADASSYSNVSVRLGATCWSNGGSWRSDILWHSNPEPEPSDRMTSASSRLDSDQFWAVIPDAFELYQMEQVSVERRNGNTSLDAHSMGTCRPCSFFHAKGSCHRGKSCKFCHACTARDVQRAKKRKASLKRGLTQAAKLEEPYSGTDAHSCRIV